MYAAFWLHPIPSLHTRIPFNPPPKNASEKKEQPKAPTPPKAETNEYLIIWPVSSKPEAPRNLQAEFKRVCAENGYFEKPYETLQELQDWHRETYGCDEFVQ